METFIELYSYGMEFAISLPASLQGRSRAGFCRIPGLIPERDPLGGVD
jgi:hypothetical protein